MSTEAPFRPREKLFEKQKVFQSIHKHTYLKGPFDKVTSVAIPLALATTSLFMIVSSFPPFLLSLVPFLLTKMIALNDCCAFCSGAGYL